MKPYFLFFYFSSIAALIGQDLDPKHLILRKGHAIEMPAMTAEFLSSLYRDHLGKKVSLSDDTQNPEFFFAQRGPMTRRQFETCLDLTIALEGWKLIPTEQDPNSLKLVKGEMKEFPSLANETPPDHSGKRGNNIALPAKNGAITMPAMTGLHAAQLYQDHTGKPVVLGSMASQVEFSFIVKGPLTNRELVQRLWKASRETGFEFQTVPGNKDLLQFVPIDLKKAQANFKLQLEKRKKSGRTRVRYVPRKKPEPQPGK